MGDLDEGVEVIPDRNERDLIRIRSHLRLSRGHDALVDRCSHIGVKKLSIAGPLRRSPAQ